MKILIVHIEVIPVKYYGGTERVVWCLGHALISKGICVEYLVPFNSRCHFAKVHFINPNIDLLSQIPDDITLVHFHHIPKNIEKYEKPYIITTHGNPAINSKIDRNTVFVSKNQAFRYNSNQYVYNGLNWDDYSLYDSKAKRKHFHFLGKASWRVKNVKDAIKLILNTQNEQLIVAGGKRLNFKMGFRFTTSKRIRFYSNIGGVEKDKILNQSKGLIFPVKWEEPFGLAIIESLYYGCPIFGSKMGSLPELVSEKFGFLSNEIGLLSEAIFSWQEYSNEECHEYAKSKFNHHVMADKYIEKYDIILQNGFLS